MFVVLVVVGLGGFIWRAAESERPIAYSPGVPPAAVAAVVAPGHEVCQTPLVMGAATNAVDFQVGTSRRPAIPLRISVRDTTGRTIAQGASSDYQDGKIQRVSFRTVPGAAKVSLCIRDVGRAPVYPYGSESVGDSGTVLDGRRNSVDLSLTFLRSHPRSALSLVPAAFRHASVFRFDWMGAWTWWVLAALLGVGAPILCAFALRSAVDDG
ncbi:MAG: hypothetical protein QOD53_285 [Thermoleophilaceae bacterium]|nr:hypothetical protein [Thermoleophilaceae bacterium]